MLGLAQSTTDRLIPDQAGFYEIRGSEGARWLAVNVDARESDLADVTSGLHRALAGIACAGTDVDGCLGANSPKPSRNRSALAAVAGCHPAVGGNAAGESSSGHSSRGAEMTSRERLESYLAELRSRLRAHIYLRAGAVGRCRHVAADMRRRLAVQPPDFAASIAFSLALPWEYCCC